MPVRQQMHQGDQRQRSDRGGGARACASAQFETAGGVTMDGSYRVGCLAGIAAAKSLNIPVLLRGESNLQSETDDALKLGVKRIAMPALLRTIDGVLAIGRLNREYYLHYAVEAGRIFAMPYAVDNEFFRAAAERARPNRDTLRAELGLKPRRAVSLRSS